MTIEIKKAANINEAIEIINSLLPNGTFEYATENYGENSDYSFDTIYRHFNGTNEYGATCFVMIEIIKSGKLDTVRFINTYRQTAVDIKIALSDNQVSNETDVTEDDSEEVFTADVMSVEDDDNDETDEPEILGYSKLYNLYHSPHEEKYSYGSMKIGDETLTFDKHKLITISAPKLGLQYDTRTKRFRYNGRIIARNKIIKFLEDKEHAKVEHKAFSEHFSPYCKTSGRFCVNIFADYIDGSDSNHSAHFDYFNKACDFVREAKEFIGTFEDVTYRIVIYFAKLFTYEALYHREANGLEEYTLPDISDIKHYPREELQTRVDEIKRAIEENQTFRDTRHESGIDFAVGLANIDLMKAQAFYEFALYETEPAPTAISETDDTEDDNNDDEPTAPELVIETQINKKGTVTIKLNGNRISRNAAEHAIFQTGDFTIINQYGKVFDGDINRNGRLRILRPEGNVLTYANLDALLDHIPFDDSHLAETEPEPPIVGTEITTDHDKSVGRRVFRISDDEIVDIKDDGRWLIHNTKVNAYIAQKLFEDGIRFSVNRINVTEDEFFGLMVERGACTIDEPESAPEPVMTFNDIVANALEMCDELTWSLCDMHYDRTCRRYRRRGKKIREWYLHRLIRVCW